MSTYLITEDGRRWLLEHGDDVDDVVAFLTETRASHASSPMIALSRQQVVARIGRGIPTDFPDPDVLIGDPDQGATRGWWEATVQRWLGQATEPAAAASTATELATEDEQASPGWPRRSRQWEDVDFSAADRRVLIATSQGIVTPAGLVISRPLGRASDLAKLAANFQWAHKPDDCAPQIWITPEALDAIGFPIDGLVEDTLAATVGTFFDATVKYHKSGFFTCQWPAVDDSEGRHEVDVVLMPFTHLDPSPSRPEDRGVIGIAGTHTELPDDEIEAAHLLADRIEWLYSIEGALPAPRWSRVGLQIAEAWMKRARPKPKNSRTAPPLLPCPLPAEIAPNGRFASPWWNPDSWRRRHRALGDGLDVEVDQQAAYLPSAEGIYLGYGKPAWMRPDPSVFNQQRPPFGVFKLSAPAGDELDGLHRRLPIPHPGMSWKKPSTFWATTVDVQQLIAPTENGGAGIAVAELQIEAAWVWPEQHQWLKGWAGALRAKLAAARLEGRADYEEMIKAIYTSYLGRLAAVGAGAWKYPYLHHQQPAWYAAIEGLTRWRALRYATRIAREHDLYPNECLADAWFYRIPADADPSVLEDPLRDDGTRANGSYRIKATTAATPS
ncbi:hypothetical protein [Mycobacterium avium]|uniref:hypothetical protein n=1 Tax=Mycobacterium avium TaxID=1764 RepID=UPI00111BF247|nr:hypothetical protein [Mycobacterium avium]